MSSNRIPSSFYRNLSILIAGAASTFYYANQMLPSEPSYIKVLILSVLLVVTAKTGYEYVNSTERETGVSIIHRPLLQKQITECNSETVRRVFYTVCYSLSSQEKIFSGEEKYDIHVELSDFFPNWMLLTVSFYESSKRLEEQYSVCDVTCRLDVKTNILSITTGYFGKRRNELISMLEQTIEDKLLAKKGKIRNILERRPK